jgi:hypothetical protein
MFRFVKQCGPAIAVAAVAATTGCASTKFVSSWQAPVEGRIEFDNKRVAAVVVSATRPLPGGETALARISRGAQEPLRTLISGDAAKDAEAAETPGANIDGAVVTRVISSEQDLLTRNLVVCADPLLWLVLRLLGLRLGHGL